MAPEPDGTQQGWYQPNRWRITVTWTPNQQGTQDLENVLTEVIAALCRSRGHDRRDFTVRIERED
jgi:hypothetical protein